MKPRFPSPFLIPSALVSCPRNAPHKSQLMPLKNLPFPLFSKRVKAGTEKIPLKKGNRRGI
jgi:hypothetical protein